MPNKNQSTDHVQGSGASGTKVTGLTPRPYDKGTARHDSAGGVSGENATSGNRNKPHAPGARRSGNG